MKSCVVFTEEEIKIMKSSPCIVHDYYSYTKEQLEEAYGKNYFVGVKDLLKK